jgi:NAD(P)H-flavin reductase
MRNPYQPKIAIIKNIKLQSPEVKLFTLKFKNKKDQLNFIPGQFIEIGLPNFGEAPFALCSKCSKLRRGPTTQIERGSNFQVCIRRAGGLTEKLHQLKIGDFVTVRGPYGNGWPAENQKSKIKNQKLLLVAGGIGIIPLRSVIYGIAEPVPGEARGLPRNDRKNIVLLYGARTYDDLLFKDEYKVWQKYIDLHITIDKPDKRWKGNVGLITSLLDKVNLQPKKLKSYKLQAFLCGPPVMYKFVLEKLKALKIPDQNIYLSLERQMHCGIGACQHCAIGSKYVCKDGPVFNWAEIKDIPGVI